MPIVVQKYGGSSVAEVEKIRKVARKVKETRERGYQVVVVVSAMGDTTDELLALAKQVSPDPARRELDMLLTCGERISMALLSMALQELGVPAISFTGSQSGIITNDAHSQARIVEVRPYRIQDELEQGKVVIVAGYQGVSYKKEVTTLGRGGSDTTAVALAAALEAVRLPELLEFLDARGVRGRALAFDGLLGREGRTFIAVPLQDVHGLEALKRDVAARFGDAVSLQEEVGTVTAVGVGLNADWSYLRRGLGVAEDLGAKVHAVHTSPLQLTLLVDKKWLKLLTARLHREFLGP